MKTKIRNSNKVITGITLLVALLFITAFKVIENAAQTQNTSRSQIKSGPYIDMRIFTIPDKVEAIRKFITGWQEVQE